MTDDIAKCPQCGRLTATPHNATPRAWWCHTCKMVFEDVDDGDIGYGRPSRRLERQEGRRPYPSADAGD